MTRPVVVLTASPRVAPGLLSLPAWQALQCAGAAWTAEADHPFAPAARDLGLEVRVLDHLDDVSVADQVVHGPADLVWLARPDDGSAQRFASDARLAVEVVAGSYDLPGAHLLDAVAVMDRLRSPGGCPWDAAQTHETLAPYAIEEAAEVADAIAGLTDGRTRYEDVREELGDLLLQVLFNARVATEARPGPTEADAPFDIDDVADTLVAKLVRRHPHVFGDSSASTPEEVSVQWQQIKAQERADKARRRSTLADEGAG